jgi:hypothetical protein
LEGRLIIYVVIISVNVRKEISFGGKVNVVVGETIVIVRTEFPFGKQFNFTA